MISMTRASVLAALLSLPSWGAWTEVGGTQGKYIQSLFLWDGVMYVGTESNGTFLMSPPSDSLAPTSLHARVNAFVGQGQAVFAATDSGVYKTSDQGAHWTHLPNPPNDETILSLSVQGDTLYAGTFLGLAVSRNGGTSWTRVGESLVQDEVEGVGGSGSLVYAGYGEEFFGGYHLSRSDDAGNTWKEVPDSGAHVTGVLFLGGRLFLASSAGLRISNDRGATWSYTPQQAIVANAKTDFFDARLQFSGGGLFFTHFGDADFASLDSGATWHGIADEPNGPACFTRAGERIYLGSQDGLFYSPVETNLAVRPRALGAAAKVPARFSIGSSGAEFRRPGSPQAVRANGRLVPSPMP